MRITIVGTDLPGRTCSPGPDFPEGHHQLHVAVQGRKVGDLLGLTRGDAPSARWDLDCTVVSAPPGTDLRGPQIQGRPEHRFVYLTWGVMDARSFRMFRRAKLWLDAVPADVMARAVDRGQLTGHLGLSDDRGQPRCAAVRPPTITWSAS